MSDQNKENSNKTEKPDLELSLNLAKEWLNSVDDETFYQQYSEIKKKENLSQ